MNGFAPRWKDLPDYILGVTKEIWEDRGIATLHHYYTPTIPVRSPASVVIGNQGVIAATMATLAEFPDRQLLGEDVIWSGDEDEGFLSSHRLLSTATHLGNGMYGPASGKKYVYRIIANCAVRNNAIYDEWLIRDQGAIVRQMGTDPKTWAADLITREGGPDHCVRPCTPDNDVLGDYRGTGNDHPIGQRYATILTRIMAAEMHIIREEYDRACWLELPAGEEAHGPAAAEQFWMSLRAAFPSATFKIHHHIGRDDPHSPPRAALYWTLTGRHEGWGPFGTPTGAEVHIMGMSHAEFGPWGLRREFVIVDETAIWKQILLQTG
jgi:hypothetical protein